MFCSKCGAQLPDGSRFCGVCGAQLGGGPAVPQPQPGAAAPAQKWDPADPIAEYKIIGDDLQLVELCLDPGRQVVAEAGGMCYMEDGLSMEAVFGDGTSGNANRGFMGKLGQAAKRALTGESLFMTVFTNNSQQRRRIAFAAPYPGRVIAVELREFGNTLICQKKAFLCAAKGINVDLALQKKLGTGFFGGEGFIMQRLSGDGLAFLHAGGTIVRRDLAPGELLRLDTGCLVALTQSVDYDIQPAANVKTALFGGEGIFLATLRGPGTVWIQSLPFARMANQVLSAATKNTGESNKANTVMNLLGQ